MLRLLRKYGSDKLFNVNKKVLIFSTHLAFIELSRNCLAEIKNLDIDSASTTREIQTLTGQNEFDLVILDAEFPEDSPVDEIVNIQNQHASTMFLVFPPDNLQNHPVVNKFRVDEFLSQPFYLPDFLDVVKKLLFHTQFQELNLDGSENYSLGNDEKGKIMQQTSSDWVNPAIIGEQLAQAMSESQAQGAFILFDGNPIVYRGDLDESVTSEITIYLLQDWDRDKNLDIVRFMRLNADGKDHLVYASKFQEFYLLVLIFEKTLPVMVARSQCTHVAYNMKKIIESEQVSSFTEGVNKNEDLSGQTEVTKNISLSESDDAVASFEEENQLNDAQIANEINGIASDESQDLTRSLQREYNTEEPEIDPDLILPDWLEDTVNETNEDKVSSTEMEEGDHLDWVNAGDLQETEETKPVGVIEDDPDTELSPAFIKNGNSLERLNLRRFEQSQAGEDLLDDMIFPWDQEGDQEPEPIKIDDNESVFDEKNTEPFIKPNLENFKSGTDEVGYEEFSSEDELERDEPIPDLTEVGAGFQKEVTTGEFFVENDIEKTDTSLDKTIPLAVNRNMSAGFSSLEPIFAGLSSLNYTNILVPRFPRHFLVGNLARSMSEWMPQLCLAFGWRLDRLSIRPQYLQWTITADPTVTPSEVINLLRRETSKRIFKLRPEYEEENPSNDFWAPGYMVLSGYYPPSRQMITDFIQNTRVRQGLET